MADKHLREIMQEAFLSAFAIGSLAQHLVTVDGCRLLDKAGCRPSIDCEEKLPDGAVIQHSVELSAPAFGVTHIGIIIEDKHLKKKTKPDAVQNALVSMSRSPGRTGPGCMSWSVS